MRSRLACAGGVEFVGSFFELLAQVEDGPFEFGDAGFQLAGFVGVPDAAGVEDFRAEEFGQAGGEAVVLLSQPLVLLLEVGHVGEQRWSAHGDGCRAGAGGGSGPGADLGAQVVMTVGERPVHSGGASDG